MIVEDIKLVAKLKALEQRALKDANASVVVGFNAKQALWLHENKEQKLKGLPRPSGLGVYWGPAGGPNFLVGPARRLAKQTAATIRNTYAKDVELLQCLFLGGLGIQRESQKSVPVEYGNLRGSAFTEKE